VYPIFVPSCSLVWYLARILGNLRGPPPPPLRPRSQWRSAIGDDAKTHKKMMKKLRAQQQQQYQQKPSKHGSWSNFKNSHSEKIPSSSSLLFDELFALWPPFT